MGKLSSIDKSMEEKGTKINTMWQFVKFAVISVFGSVVQFGVLNIMANVPAIRALYAEAFHFFVFTYTVEQGGLGYFIAFNTANILAQLVNFFLNRKKTFNSGANIAVTLPIYMSFTVALLCFSAWLSPIVYGLLIEKIGDVWSLNIATMICSAIQFFLYFPVDKLLFKEKKTSLAKSN